MQTGYQFMIPRLMDFNAVGLLLGYKYDETTGLKVYSPYTPENWIPPVDGKCHYEGPASENVEELGGLVAVITFPVTGEVDMTDTDLQLCALHLDFKAVEGVPVAGSALFVKRQ